MESSEITNQEVINLGKAIITELGMIVDCNTPARWLVHYIAENIHKSENCRGEEKETAERQCVDAIFKLWHHRSELPRGINPFSEFDSVFRGLSRLDNSSQKPYFNEFSQFDHQIAPEEAAECKQWVDIAISIDKAAKELVSESFNSAAALATTERSRKILKLAPEDSGEDIRIMLSFLSGEEANSKENEIKAIESKIEKIEALKSICDMFIEKYQNEIAVINK
ncbi:hypothetical protein L1D22_17940 [Vibrio sp. Isolate34]|uniref:hypothetical protein n=1 Tax=Vibrio sp. Isolate34 TaxID=2908540 RepID=UPI001EFD3139|nr:hypothetical protein [Vibrio sp. Isolate34]MCG9641739.1 hypothetical protein [Vibrio sp. Isolate34]